jgi:CyaY protein
MQTLMNESEFHQRVDAILSSLEALFDDVDADIDCELSSGILTITFENSSKIIVNRQTPNREIWVAAKSGGFHFRYVNNAWRNTRESETLEALLTDVIAQQSGEDITINLA